MQRSAAASDPYLLDSADEPEVEDKMYTWTPLPAPNMELLTKPNPIILSLEQLCAPINEPANPTCSSTLPLSTIGGECPSMGTEGGNHNMLHPLSPEVVASPRATNVSENNRADVLEVEGWSESDAALFDGEELDSVWRNIDLTVDDSSSDSSDGLPAVNLGRNLPPPGTSRDRHLASEEQYKQNYSNRTSSSHMTQPQVTRHDIVQKQEDRPTFCCPPKTTSVKVSSSGVFRQQLKLPTSSGAPCLPKTTTGKDLPTGPNKGFIYPMQQLTAGKGLSTGPNQHYTYSRQQLELPTSSDLLQTDSECSFKPAETQKDASSSYPSASHSSVGRGKQESVPRAPLVTESCPMCGTAFPQR